MARKPTRFWHPARRLLARAQEKVRATVTRDDTPPSLNDLRPRLQHYLRAMYGESVMIESLAPPKQAGWPVRALRALALVKERGRSESDAERIRLPATLPSLRTDVSPLEQYRVIAVQHAERMRRASALHAREVSSDLERDLFQLAEAATVDAQIVEGQPGLRTALEAARAESMMQRPKPRWRTDIELRVEEMVRRAWTRHDVDADAIDVPVNNDAESNATWARRTANALEAKYGRKAARAYRRVPEITLWQTTISAQLPDEKQFAIETETREAESEPSPASQKSSSRSAMPGPSSSRSSQNRHGTTRGDAGGEDASSRSEAGGEEDRGDVGASKDERPPEAGTARTSEVDPDRDSDEERAGVVPADGAGGKDVQQGVGHSGEAVEDAMLADGVTFRYPEWDYYVQNFRA